MFFAEEMMFLLDPLDFGDLTYMNMSILWHS